MHPLARLLSGRFPPYDTIGKKRKKTAPQNIKRLTTAYSHVNVKMETLHDIKVVKRKEEAQNPH